MIKFAVANLEGGGLGKTGGVNCGNLKEQGFSRCVYTDAVSNQNGFMTWKPHRTRHFMSQTVFKSMRFHCLHDQWNRIVLKTLHFWRRFQNDPFLIMNSNRCRVNAKGVTTLKSMRLQMKLRPCKQCLNKTLIWSFIEIKHSAKWPHHDWEKFNNGVSIKVLQVFLRTDWEVTMQILLVFYLW